jgi:aminoglycoside 6'-N-acetyltransferase I
MMHIRCASQDDLESWVKLRQKLWNGTYKTNLSEAQAILASQLHAAYLILEGEDTPLGFIEGALYLDNTQKYGYVEGWYVESEFRGQGLGGELLDALEEWILHQSISLVLSDTIPKEYPLSPKAHLQQGFEDLMNIQVFIKKI